MAVRYGHARVVSALLSHNTESLDAPNIAGCAPLHYAALYGRAPIVSILVESLAYLWEAKRSRERRAKERNNKDRKNERRGKEERKR